MDKKGEFYVADRRLYLNADRSKVCEEGDPECASLYAAKGHLIPAKDAVAFGLVQAAPEAEAKSAEQSQDKASEKSEDKAAAPPKKKAKKAAKKKK